MIRDALILKLKADNESDLTTWRDTHVFEGLVISFLLHLFLLLFQGNKKIIIKM